MSNLGHAGAMLMLLFGGLATGGIWVIAVDRLAVWNRMSVVEYATDFRRTLKHVDPMMPIFVSLSGLGAVLFSTQSSGSSRLFGWLGLLCLAVIMIGSILFGEPINSKFRRLAEGTPPEGAEGLRTFWRRFHFARTGVAVVALIFLIAAVIAAV
ncbi:anthrone oxygenase family protein [Nocardia sp. CA-107356]|uniref:anthrone oxygenase family protein n=1 Tax=Nocardia sp. CA-107356 TaxID=3239972 RepID=UPI003D8AE237